MKYSGPFWKVMRPRKVMTAAFASADVAIEFTTPFTAYNNIKKCFDRDIKVVTGSTGWQKDHWQEINDMCKYGLHTLFWSSNFSLGVYLFNKLKSRTQLFHIISIIRTIINKFI